MVTRRLSCVTLLTTTRRSREARRKVRAVSDAGDQASEQGRFAGREFIARYFRETGQAPPAAFAYEMGYLRGRSDAALGAVKMFDESSPARKEERKGSDDDTK